MKEKTSSSALWAKAKEEVFQYCFSVKLINIIKESKSSTCCYQSQNYKIWKQFTTYIHITIILKKLLSITKLQNLKAIHNVLLLSIPLWYVVINHKTTKFESNSQHFCPSFLRVLSCYQSQNYKIWKQFTTSNCSNFFSASLLSITKLQNLKAIHNLALE